MHYSSTIATQNFGQKTMTAKINPQSNDPIMGQRNGLSETDVVELRRMYCMPGGFINQRPDQSINPLNPESSDILLIIKHF
ncbi:unnamed protein product [Meloidogyne enterolobii]|uniref:Uncharacterized protein n=1 Tax=Meloidogyne enterolobii TaxID=390850 RepID=A0ACB1AS59_MELEN